MANNPIEDRTVITFDPGGTTGFSVIEVVNGVGRLVAYGQFPTFLGLPNIDKYIKGKVDVVYEDFYLVKVNVDLAPIKVIGAIQYWASVLRINNDIRIYKQSPGERMFVDKRFSKPYPHVRDHARSALLHGMAHLYKNCGNLTNYDFTVKGESYN